jgi:hypothetical protein
MECVLAGAASGFVVYLIARRWERWRVMLKPPDRPDRF